MSEFEELKEVTLLPDSQERQMRLEDEMGDIFFASVNLARHYGISPEVSLANATQKFKRRFAIMEQLIAVRVPAVEMSSIQFSDWDSLWKQAKVLANQQEGLEV
jgi:uncharacterized protein YabN with tetrapyrrole methylase and pyrophosphatase domain